jgi:hypothetical protein
MIREIKKDVVNIHSIWMSVAYPYQSREHSILGKWRPETTVSRIVFFIWAVIGLAPSVAFYPILLISLVTSATIENLMMRVESKGISKTVQLFLVAWLALTTAIYARSGQDEAVAVLVSSIIAIANLLVSIVFRYRGSRSTTYLISYPTAYNSVFIPPIVAAVISSEIGSKLLSINIVFANKILEILPRVISETIYTQFSIEGLGHIIMWFILSTLIGWLTAAAVILGKKFSGMKQKN